MVDTENNPASAVDISLNRHALDAAVVAGVGTAYNAAKIIVCSNTWADDVCVVGINNAVLSVSVVVFSLKRQSQYWCGY